MGQMSFNRELHLKFLKDLDRKEHAGEYILLGHIRINAIYWALTALSLLGHGPWTETFEQFSPLTLQEIVDFVEACRNDDGGYGGNKGLDSHILFTLSAVQIMRILGKQADLSVDAIVKCTPCARSPALMPIGRH